MSSKTSIRAAGSLPCPPLPGSQPHQSTERSHEAAPPFQEKPSWLRYVYACVSVVVALLARIVLDRLFGYRHPYATFYVAALLSAWYGGLGPALVSTLGGAVAIVSLAFAPPFLESGGPATLVGFEFYFIVSFTGVILLEAQRRAERRSARNAELARRRMLEVEEATGRRLRAEAEARDALERLHEAQKLESIGLLAGGIAHDFNNLLTGVLGSASLAAEMVPIESTAHRMLEVVLSSASRAAELTSQLLAYSGQGAYLTDAVDLSEVTRQAIETLRASFPPSVELRIELRDELPKLRADPAQIRQMASNLIENAAEAIGSRPEGKLAVSTDVLVVEDPRLYATAAVGEILAGAYVVLHVEDNGEGIGAAILPRIFEPFVTSRFMGRGLGLAAVAGIVRVLKGVVLVSSKPAAGSLFTVLLPVPKDPRR